MSNSRIPKEIRDDLTKALGFLQSDKPEKASFCMVHALRALASCSDAVKSAMEDRVCACLDVFARHPRVNVLLEGSVSTGADPLPYRVGQEGTLAFVLEGLAKMLRDQEAVTRKAAAFAARKERLSTLWETGKTYLANGQSVLAEAFFERLLVEFPEEEKYLLQAGELLCAAKAFDLAQIYYHALLDVHPKLSAAYSAAISVAMERGAFKECEALFFRVFKTLGTHPKTFLRMALLYEAWGKPEEAIEKARRALDEDPALSEAENLIERISHLESSLPCEEVGVGSD